MPTTARSAAWRLADLGSARAESPPQGIDPADEERQEKLEGERDESLPVDGWPLLLQAHEESNVRVDDRLHVELARDPLATGAREARGELPVEEESLDRSGEGLHVV